MRSVRLVRLGGCEGRPHQRARRVSLASYAGATSVVAHLHVQQQTAMSSCRGSGDDEGHRHDGAADSEGAQLHFRSENPALLTSTAPAPDPAALAPSAADGVRNNAETMIHCCCVSSDLTKHSRIRSWRSLTTIVSIERFRWHCHRCRTETDWE